eukprot:gene13677-19565_t
MSFALKSISGKAGVAKSTAAKRSVSCQAVTLPALPYAQDAFGDILSSKSFDFHYGKHHRAYVDNLNKQIAGTEMDNKSLEEIVIATWANGSPTPEFNNAAQVWNHTFFWEGMKPGGGGAPGAKLAEAITRDFGSVDEFKVQFKAAGATQFGSGWAWLVADSAGKLSIAKTPNAVNPKIDGKTPLLTCDVWEHAYYIDYQNRRPDFLQTFLESLVNWEAVEARFAAL